MSFKTTADFETDPDFADSKGNAKFNEIGNDDFIVPDGGSTGDGSDGCEENYSKGFVLWVKECLGGHGNWIRMYSENLFRCLADGDFEINTKTLLHVYANQFTRRVNLDGVTKTGRDVVAKVFRDSIARVSRDVIAKIDRDFGAEIVRNAVIKIFDSLSLSVGKDALAYFGRNLTAHVANDATVHVGRVSDTTIDHDSAYRVKQKLFFEVGELDDDYVAREVPERITRPIGKSEHLYPTPPDLPGHPKLTVRRGMHNNKMNLAELIIESKHPVVLDVPALYVNELIVGSYPAHTGGNLNLSPDPAAQAVELTDLIATMSAQIATLENRITQLEAQ